MPPHAPHSVLTGDLVLSERISRSVRKSIPGLLEASAAELQRMEIAISEVDVFRGDSWQVIVRRPEDALFAAVYFRAAGRASVAEFDTRVGIGIGAIEYEGSGGVSTGYGSAYTLSGRTLDEMPRDRRIQVASADLNTTPLLDASLHLLDRIAGQWTASQARVIAASMSGRSQEEIGAAWAPRPISQQAVAQHVARASWHAVDHLLTAWDQHISAQTATT
jgi:hypothetical protein